MKCWNCHRKSITYKKVKKLDKKIGKIQDKQKKQKGYLDLLNTCGWKDKNEM